jgi:hypothetical protein
VECAIKFDQIYFSNTETKKKGEANEIRLCNDYVMWGAMINKEYWSCKGTNVVDKPISKSVEILFSL